MKRLALIIIALTIFQTSAQAAVPAIEREALVALYNSTNGEEWRSNSNWLVGDPCTNDWHGVGCSQNENITLLDLERNNLVGTLPGELGNLVSLVQMILWVNDVSGPIPAEIVNLNQLRYLDVRNNELSGPIPSGIGNLSNLQVLRLEGNQLTGSIPPEFGNLTKLWFLELESNQLSGPIPAELDNLTKLRDLRLSENELSGPIPPEIGNMTWLNSLDLSDNKLSGLIPPELVNLTNLDDINLSRNKLSGSIPSGFGSLGELENLNLSWNQLSGSIPPEFGNLTRLWELDLVGNKLSGSIPVEFGGLGNLRRLKLTANQLSGSIPSTLGSLTNLAELLLNNNQLSGPIPVELGNLHKMRWLDLSNNRMNGRIPGSFGSTPKRIVLDLSNNQFTGSIPAELGNLFWTSRLILANNQLEGLIPAELGILAGLQLNGNQLSGPIPKEFAAQGIPGSKVFDLHWNALFTADAELDAILDVKSDSDWSSTQTIAPENFHVSNVGPDSVTLAWNPIEFITDEGGYRVWYGTSSGGPYTDGGITASKSITSHTVSGLDLEQGYYFVVTTETNSHENNSNLVISENSNEVSVSNLLARPTGIKATDGTFIDVVKVSFNLVEGATVYRVFRCIDRGQTCGLPIGYPKTGSFDDRQAVPGTVYYYRVRACTNNACGKFSVADAGFATIQPERPIRIRASDGTYSDRVQISWDGIEGATVYRVFRCLDTGPNCGSPIGFPNRTSFDDLKGDPGTVYYYRIKACTNQHCSKFSVLNAGHRSVPPSIEDDAGAAVMFPDQQVPIPVLSTWGRWLLALVLLGFGLVLINYQHLRGRGAQAIKQK